MYSPSMPGSRGHLRGGGPTGPSGPTGMTGPTGTVGASGPTGSSGALILPTRTVLIAGSGQYVVKPGCRYINVRMKGAGAGGAGSGHQSETFGADGGTTVFGSLVTFGGTHLSTGGLASGGDINIQGSPGGLSSVGDQCSGGIGGGGVPGGIAPVLITNALPGQSAPANSGKGGGGGAIAASFGGNNGGRGGGEGGYLEKLSSSLAIAYLYSVGAGGLGGAAGNFGTAGGNGGSGFIIIDEFY